MNVMPLLVAKKINAEWDKIDAQIFQLDKSLVQAMGELKIVIICLSFDHQVHQCIKIVIVDIPKAYGVLRSRYWSSKLQGYFVAYQPHLWLPYKGRNNQIQVESEPYTKYIVTPRQGRNEIVSFC